MCPECYGYGYRLKPWNSMLCGECGKLSNLPANYRQRNHDIEQDRCRACGAQSRAIALDRTWCVCWSLRGVLTIQRATKKFTKWYDCFVQIDHRPQEERDRTAILRKDDIYRHLIQARITIKDGKTLFIRSIKDGKDDWQHISVGYESLDEAEICLPLEHFINVNAGWSAGYQIDRQDYSAYDEYCASSSATRC